LSEPRDFIATAGKGVLGTVEGRKLAIGNAGLQDPDLVTAAQRRLDDAAPLVRAAAAWAFLRLAPPARCAAERARRLPREDDPLVREEWERVRPGVAA